MSIKAPNRADLESQRRSLELALANAPLRLARCETAAAISPSLAIEPTIAEAERQEQPAETGPTCATCRCFAPVTISAPIMHANGAKGQCRAGPPDVAVARHDQGVEMGYRIVDATTPACGLHHDIEEGDFAHDHT